MNSFGLYIEMLGNSAGLPLESLPQNYWTIPWPVIKKSSIKHDESPPLRVRVEIQTKIGQNYHIFILESPGNEILKEFKFFFKEGKNRSNNITSFYAPKYYEEFGKALEQKHGGSALYSLEADFRAQGLDLKSDKRWSKYFRIFQNTNYKTCPSYPDKFVVPS